LGIVSAATCLLALASERSSAQASDDNGGPELRCEKILFQVALAPDQPTSFTVVTWLCARGTVHGKTIQVLVHGATYDHNTWDWPLQPETYSYVRAATAAGYATLNMDRVGHGESSRVSDGALLDLNGDAFAIHQIIQELRGGQLVTHQFGRVRATRILLAGESIAANIVWLEAGTYHDVDGLVVAGSAHTFGPGFADIPLNTVPTFIDPILGPRGFPPNYFTSLVGSRGFLFYWAPNADPAVIALDELLKQTVTLGEFTSVGPTLPVSAQVNVPTLITIGDHDHLFCIPPSCSATNSVANETSFWSPAACPELVVVPDSGHNLNLHRNAQTYFAIVREWADRRVGASTKDRAPQPCQP
jgi:pimeloyl-ACP methyl ester carboxylesterase